MIGVLLNKENAKRLPRMRKDLRPYYIKKAYLRFRSWYARHYIEPHLDHLGKHYTLMSPWYIHISGPNISIGDAATIVAEKDARVRIGVWGHELGQGRIVIGDAVMITPGVRISACEQVSIGHSCMLANGVYITDSDWHGIYNRVERPREVTPVDIGNNVWLGDHATVLKGVRIGDNSIVAARAVVVRDVPENVIVAGNPAKVVKQLDPGRKFTTRADFFNDPVALAKEYDRLDREYLKDNSLVNWLHSVVKPNRRH